MDHNNITMSQLHEERPHMYLPARRQIEIWLPKQPLSIRVVCGQVTSWVYLKSNLAAAKDMDTHLFIANLTWHSTWGRFWFTCTSISWYAMTYCCWLPNTTETNFVLLFDNLWKVNEKLSTYWQYLWPMILCTNSDLTVYGQYGERWGLWRGMDGGSSCCRCCSPVWGSYCSASCTYACLTSNVEQIPVCI